MITLRLLAVCALLIVVVPPAGAGAENGPVKRPPTELWNAYPLVQTPDPVIAGPTRTTATATPQAEELPSSGPFSPSQPSVPVTVAALTIVASAVVLFAFMTLQTAGPSVGRGHVFWRRRRRAETPEDAEAAPPAMQADDTTPDTEPPADVEDEPEAPSEKELSADAREVEVLRAKRRGVADDHAALVAKLKR